MILGTKVIARSQHASTWKQWNQMAKAILRGEGEKNQKWENETGVTGSYTPSHVLSHVP